MPCIGVADGERVVLLDGYRRIAALKRMKAALARLAAACSGRGPTSKCPILDALESEKLS